MNLRNKKLVPYVEYVYRGLIGDKENTEKDGIEEFIEDLDKYIELMRDFLNILEVNNTTE